MRLAVFLLCAAASAQSFTQRGFLESRNFFYPQAAPGDSARAVSEALLRWESTWKPNSWFQLNTSLDARSDSHRQTERSLHLDWADRGLLRPTLSVRRLSVLFHKGGANLELGRQFIRWGKTDILNPTDRFAPKDFLNVLNSDFLGVTAARLTYEHASDTFDLIYQPLFTPSRGPLLDQRWAAWPEALRAYPLVSQTPDWPGRGALGARWGHVGAGQEYSLSFYDGYNHLPLLAGHLRLAPSPALYLQRYFAHMRMYGADYARPLRWFTVKAEAAYFTSKTPTADEYALYVVQLERTSGEWVFVGGYAGEYVTRARSPLSFAPDRGLAKTLLGRASYNIDANRSVAFESALRQDGAGMYAKAEFTQTLGQHFRWTSAFTLLRGDPSDFLGQFRLNSNLQLVLRYSF